MHTLVVAQNAKLRSLLETVLKSRGHEATFAESGEDAWQSCTTHSYQLALIDWQMPGSPSAPELCRRIRDLPWGSQMILLVITTQCSAAELEAIIDVGADDYVAKPVTKGHLRVRLTVVEQRLQMRFAHMLTAEELRRERNFISAVLDTSAALVMVLDRKGRIVRFNRACELLSGYSAAQVRGKRPVDLLIAPEEAHCLETFRQQRGSEGSRESEAWLLARDGARSLVRWSHNTLRSEQGVDEYTICTGIDITHREQLEGRIIQVKREWEQTFDTVPELIFLVDTAHRITRVNRAMASLLGRQPRELIGKLWFNELHGSETPPANCIARALDQQCELSGEAYFERLGHNYLLSVTPLPDPSTGSWRAVIVARDLTERERAEVVARRQAMIDQIEEIFSAFRHEVGNAINTLRTTIDVLCANYDVFDREKRLEYLTRCDATVQVAERLLQMIRHYQQYDRLQLVPVSLSRFLREQQALLTDLAASSGVDCVIRLAPGEIMVDADETALHQVIVNLVNNAVAAVQEQPEPQIVIVNGQVQGWRVISVIDNGVGIPRENLARIFTPLFTTRHEGSGLGLAVVQKLMTQMNGEVVVSSEPGEGTTFELRFPQREV
jgi:PAS domain S-box-containing protein